MADSAVRGEWAGPYPAPGDSKIPFDRKGVVAVHAVLLHTGKVLMWNGRYEDTDLLFAAWTWDPETGDKSPALPFDGETMTKKAWEDDKDVDLFCSHHVVLEDGRVMALGGGGGRDEAGKFLPGHAGVFIFDPEDGSDGNWSKHGRMNFNRWYPTAVNMLDGSVVVFSGRGFNPPDQDNVVSVPPHEILSPPAYTPTTLSGDETKTNLYPGLHLVKGGKIFYLPTTWQYIFPKEQNPGYAPYVPTISFSLGEDNSIVVEDYRDANNNILKPRQPWRQEGTSVLLPPAHEGRILLLGGGRPKDDGQHEDTEPRSWEILETQGPSSPKWAKSGLMHKPRINVNAVILPDGKVLIVGGHNNQRYEHEAAGQALTAEIFDPDIAINDSDQEPIVETGRMAKPRMYHSTAILLPDGSVLAAGGADPHKIAKPGEPIPSDYKNFEIYRPPYFFRGPRPTLSSVSENEIPFGAKFSIECPKAANIGKVVLLRPGCVTHHTDPNQRLVELTFTADEGGGLSVTMEDDPTVAPPGYYMLFIVDHDGLPCEKAQFIRLPASIAQ